MLERLLLAAVFVVVAVIVALVMERRRHATTAPVRDPYPVPRQIFRRDFPRPDAPWLVALFSSKGCGSCNEVLAKVEPLASEDVVVVDVPYEDQPDVHRRYGIEGVPMVVIADAEGVVRNGFVGPVTATDLWAAVAGARESPQ